MPFRIFSDCNALDHAKCVGYYSFHEEDGDVVIVVCACRCHRDMEAVALRYAVRTCITAIDAEMKKPSDLERGRRIARITNELELALDRAERFGVTLRLGGSR